MYKSMLRDCLVLLVLFYVVFTYFAYIVQRVTS